MGKLIVIGLDGLSAEWVNAWQEQLPNLKYMMDRGISGTLKSITQPVTPAAWTSIITGQDQGHFGFTDFIYRKSRAYTDIGFVHSKKINTATIFKLVSEHHKKAWSIGVPISYPPVEIKDGGSLACFMAPNHTGKITSPPAFKDELTHFLASPLVLDVTIDEHDVDYMELKHKIHAMDQQRFDILAYVMEQKEWDLIFGVCMGTDRIGHYYVEFQEESHERYDANNAYKTAIKDHYQYCDHRLGEVLKQLDDDCNLIVLSDHGMQQLDAKFNINDWLIERGYLVLQQPLQGTSGLFQAPIDWGKSCAWASGYGGQIYFNTQIRNEHGFIAEHELDGYIDKMAAELQTYFDELSIELELYTADELFSGEHKQDCPHLCLKINDYKILTSDRIGHTEFITSIKELGRDGGAHSADGFIAMVGPDIPAAGTFDDMNIYDVAPSILDLLHVPKPLDWEGRILHAIGENVYTDAEEAELTNRLKALYLD
ncbi:alkaline phosphatase family protein [Paenibacillus campi]|uniref:alkaline phosphatase family protein n=1 Tax=Paenibacillus campi TaxID=3106031 RepID=UPI002AFF9CA0|nr:MULTISPECIES: alkaline phosphatase family protein [unclassified Paenibacillus]